MPHPPSNVLIHELIDLITAVQHVIVDSLSELSSNEISRLKSFGSITATLVTTVSVMNELQHMDPSVSQTVGQHITKHLNSTPGWNEGGGYDAINVFARDNNEYLKQVPGMTGRIIAGLLNPDYVDGDPVETDIPERLTAYLAPLNNIVKQVGKGSRLGERVGALYWNIKGIK